MEIQKIITDNPLIDELVYYTKILGFGTLLKMEDEANKNETMETLKASDIYISCLEGKASLYQFEFTINDLVLAGIDASNPLVQQYLLDRNTIPEPNKTNLLNILVERYKENYEEQNNYYRKLSGKPEYIAKYLPVEFHYYLNPSDYYIDISKPLHKYSLEDINYLESLGILNQVLIVSNCLLKSWTEKLGSIETLHKNICYKEWLYVPEEFYPDLEEFNINTQKPLHLYSGSEITTLNHVGVIDYFKDLYPEKEYLDFLGEKKLDIYTARKTPRFGILYVPRVAFPELHDNFYDRLVINRDFVLRTIYSEAYRLHSVRYDNFIAIYIIVLSMIDMLIAAPEYLIKRDLFDIRTIQYLLESYGVTFFSDIPLKYQQKIIKALNLLLKYKSSPRCMKEISSLFGIKDIFIYKYFLIKERIMEDNGEFYFTDPRNIRLTHEASLGSENLSAIYELVDTNSEGYDRVWKSFSEDESLIATIQYDKELEAWVLIDSSDKTIAELQDMEDPVGNWILNSFDFSQIYSRFTDPEIDDYTLKFCKVLLDESVEDYVRDNDNFRDYFTTISNDPYWNGDKSPELVYNTIVEEKFNLIRSKYISIDVLYDLSELSVQRPYLYSMVFDGEERASSLMISVYKISPTKEFRFNDLICYLISLSFKYYGVLDTIPQSRAKIMHIIGFNFEADLNYLQNYLIEKEITDLDLLGKTDKYGAAFIPSGSYPTYEMLLYHYTKNTDLREELIFRMNNADNKRTYDIYRKIFDALMIQEETNKLFRDNNGEVYETYQDFIMMRDPILAQSLIEIDDIIDRQEREHVISDIISAAVDALEYALGDDDVVKYAFSNFGSVSYEAITGYMRHLIEFFKSFTVQIAEMNSIYQISTPFDNKLSPIDDFHSIISKFIPTEVMEMRDNLNQIITSHQFKDNISFIERVYIEPVYD